MNSSDTNQIIRNGLWQNNPALVQMLGLCPLLAVSASVVNALAMGIATLIVLALSNLLVSLLKRHVTDAVRLPVFIMVIASCVSMIDMLMSAFSYPLYQILGIFIPLIVTNCNVLGRAEAFAAKNPPLPALLDGVMMGTGFLLVLVVLGATRELIGTGAIFNNMHLLFGETARHWTIQLFPDYQPFLFAVLPPGAFLIMGFLVAAKNKVDATLHARATQAPHAAARRVRTTGNIE